jgi:hypothetical protein
MTRAALLSILMLAGNVLAATPEDRLTGVFQAVEANHLDDALQRVDALIRDYPNFRLAYLVRGDLLLARSRPLETFGNVPGNVVKTVPQERIEGLRAEALARLRAQRQRPADDRLPRAVLQLDAEQKHVLLVDSRRSRLYVFANEGGKPRLVADYYVTLGKNGMEKTREGDQKTPVGVYFVTGILPRSKLTDFYGAGAFPINYPNEWTAAWAATATASGCTACLRRSTPGRRARATAASCSPTPTSSRSAATWKSGARR